MDNTAFLFNQMPMMAQMSQMNHRKNSFNDIASASTPDCTLSSLMTWYEQDNMQESLKNNPTIQPLDLSYDHQLFESDPFDMEPIQLSSIDLAPLPFVSEGNQNHRSMDNDVLDSVDDVLDIFGTDNANSVASVDITSSALIGELEPTPLFSDFPSPKSSSNKRSLEQVQAPPKKKQRTVEEAPENANFFRAYQAEQWTQRYEELCEFAKEHGNCQVPHTYTKSPALARWVKRQRYQYKLRSENKPSTMTDERITVLERIGFIWDSHVAAWDERKSELIEYRKMFGHCNVPSNYSENRQLAVWVKRQRRQYKFYCEGKASSMTKDRIAALQAIGFEWELRCRESRKN